MWDGYKYDGNPPASYYEVPINEDDSYYEEIYSQASSALLSIMYDTFQHLEKHRIRLNKDFETMSKRKFKRKLSKYLHIVSNYVIENCRISSLVEDLVIEKYMDWIKNIIYNCELPINIPNYSIQAEEIANKLI